MCDRLLFHRRFFSNIFQENFFHQEILVFFSFRQIFLSRSFSSCRRWYFLLSVFPRRMFFQEIFVYQEILFSSFKFQENLFFQDTLFAFQEILLFIFFLYFRRFFFFHEICFFCSEYFFQKIGLQEKKNNFLRNKKRKKNPRGKKRKERITLTLWGNQSPENRK